ncbi:MAG: lysine--tRNA ligase [archaeon]|nr:MAG: lysine--tRNA ligase [archaeon]
MSREDQIIKERLRKIEELRKQGINPYPYKFDKKNYCEELQKKHSKLKKEQEAKGTVKIAGRILVIRNMGKICFGKLQDNTGQIQVVLQNQKTPEKEIKFFKKYIDSGDILGVEGSIFKTKRGELSVLAKKITLLTKSIKPLPEKWHGLQDKEERYRKRYLDLIMNPKVKELFLNRQKIVNAIREFMEIKGFTEVETPILQSIYGGASANPFESNLNALNMKVYMRISNELYLKRLIVGGFEKIFEFSRDFRNEGIDRLHNPEFTQVETMWAYADYEDNMKFCEEMVSFITKKIHGKTKIKFQDKEIDFKTPWKRIKFLDVIKKHTKADFSKVKKVDEAKKIANKLNVDITNCESVGEIIINVFEELVQDKIIQPTIVYDYPYEAVGLAKSGENKKFVKSFEPIVNGWELGLSYCEQNDPQALKEYWKEAEEKYKRGDIEAQPTDPDFINALEIGMPPTSGMGMGIDRLTMLMTDQTSIRDVLFFPFMRPEKPLKVPSQKEKRTDMKRIKEVFISPEARKIGLKTGYAIISGVKIYKKNPGLEKLKKSLKAKRDKKKIECMQKAFRAFGVDPTKRAPSAEALIKRVESGKDIYNINTLVDAYNLSSVKENLPMAAYDLEKVDFPITLKEAKGEEITFIGGEKKKTQPGEIVYADEFEILCLDFNYRDCNKTKITEKTKEVIIFVDGCEGISNKEILSALNNTCDLIIKFNGGKVMEKKVVE